MILRGCTMNTKFTVQTDKKTKLILESNLIYSMWKIGVARGGADVPFEVRTAFVGQGAEIEIKCEGDDYGKIEKVKDKIYNNRYNGSIHIPEDIKPGESVWFTVKLSKLGLKGESNVIPAAPPVVLKKMEWDRKEVCRDDEVKISVEFESGVEDGDEATIIIYEHLQDDINLPVITIPTEIKNRKINLIWKFNYQDEVNTIPTEEEKQKYNKHYLRPQFFFIVVIDGVKIGLGKESGLMQFKDTVEFVLRDEHGTPLPNTEVIITLADGTEQKITTDENGIVKLTDIPPGPYNKPSITTNI